MPGKIWRIGFRELTTKGDLPEGTTADTSWRLPSGAAGLLIAPETRRDLVDMYKVLGGTLPALADFRRPELVRAIATRINQGIERGDIVVLHRRAPSAQTTSASGGGGSGSQNSSGGSSSSSSGGGGNSGGGPNSEKTWVDIQLVDEEGEPIPNERYILKVTDGSLREGSLDASGRVRVSGIDPGTCTVVFPDLDTKEWKRKS